jgi:molybdopterin molybdotransferase
MQSMIQPIHPDEATKILEGIPLSPRATRVSLADALGRVLIETVPAPLPSPPFDKSTVDGYAVSSKDPSSSFRVLETIAAGKVPAGKVTRGHCSKIMTGAMLPEGADKVVRVEYTEERDGFMRIIEAEATDNVIRRGANLQAGDPVLTPRLLRSQDIGILASLGLTAVPVAVAPRIGIITTGSEIKSAGEELGPGQIYNSNGPQLAAQVKAAFCEPQNLGVVPDEPHALEESIRSAAEDCSVLLLSGGVSMGDFDFVPQAVRSCGFEVLFHKVAVKPGKPLLFARKGDVYAFGLPGNPVSTFVVFEMFVKGFLFRMMGAVYRPTVSVGILADTIERRDTERVEYRPVRLEGKHVHPLKYHGSTHLSVLAETTGLIRVEQGQARVTEGTELPVRLLTGL